jgi:hypothetical protein
MICVLLALLMAGAGVSGLQTQQSSVSRRSWFSTVIEPLAVALTVQTAAMPEAVMAKQGEGAKMFVNTDPNTADAALGGKADSWGENSRNNGIYASQQKALYGGVLPGSTGDGDAGDKGKVDKKVLKARLEELTACRMRLASKVEPALAKGKWPAVVDACNAELFQFKSYLSAATKLSQGGRVCLIDATQRGITMPQGMDPDNCPLQLVQVRILQYVNDVYVEASRKDVDAAAKSFAKFNAACDEYFAAANKAAS